MNGPPHARRYLCRHKGLLVTAVPVPDVAPLVHDTMLDRIVPQLRERLDEAERASARVHVGNDGQSDWY